jgi:pullulanase
MTKDGYTLTTQVNSQEVPGFAFFSDTLRDAIRGGNSNNSKPGYVANAGGFSGNINSCFTGSPNWCKSPTQSINYASCHDNHTLFDRITMSTPEVAFADRVKMNNLAAAIVLTSQGVPFIHAGEEMLRSKPLEDGTFDHNSYKSPDAVNNLKWADLSKAEYQTTFAYYQGLIAFRKAHPALCMTDAQEVSEKITRLGGLDFNVTGFHIAAGANGEENELIVVFNPNTEASTVELPKGKWTVYINGDKAGLEPLDTVSGTATAEPISAMVLVKSSGGSSSIGIIGGADGPTAIFVTGNFGGLIAIAAAVLCSGIAVIVALKKRKK